MVAYIQKYSIFRLSVHKTQFCEVENSFLHYFRENIVGDSVEKRAMFTVAIMEELLAETLYFSIWLRNTYNFG